MNFMFLSNEVILYILKFCTPKSLCNLGKTNKRLRELSNMEELWKFLCLRDYGVKETGEDFDSFSELYKYFLHRYGHLIGTYIIGLPMKGLAEIVFQDYLQVWLWQRQRDAKNPIRKLLMFKIRKGIARGTADVVCCIADRCHEGNLKKAQAGRRFQLRCLDTKDHYSDKFVQLIQEIFCANETFQCLRLLECIYKSLLDEGLELYPIKIPDRKDVPESLLSDGKLPESLVEPGVFRLVFNVNNRIDKSFYILEYNSESNITLFKISTENRERTDPVVKVMLYKAFVPSEDLGHKMYHETILPKVPNGTYVTVPPKDIPEQDFPVLAPELQNEYEALKSGRCKGRFGGFAPYYDVYEQINFIVFDNDTVAILYLDVDEFQFFVREKRKFTEKRGPAIYVNTINGR